MNHIRTQNNIAGLPQNQLTLTQFIAQMNQDFQYDISSYTGYFLVKFTINDYCNDDFTQIFTLHLKINETPYQTAFYFEWDHDQNPTTPKVVVQPSQNINVIPTFGGSSGVLVSDISTKSYDYYEVDLYRRNGPNNSFIKRGSDTKNTIGGAAFNFNPNQIPITNPTDINDPNKDKPINQPGEIYKIHLRVGTSGCPEDEQWSYFTIDPNNPYGRVTGGSFNSGNTLAANEQSHQHWHGMKEDGIGVVLNLHPKEVALNAQLEARFISMNQMVVKSVFVHAGRNSIPITDIPNGAYIIWVVDQDNQLVYRGKLIH